MKSAIVFPTGDRDEYNMWTVSQAMDYGWMFTIPVWGRHGNGYIFDSDYITAEQAKEEVEQFLGHEINVGKQINFDPGALDNVWINNCCAVGLSASFVEPLEASSIGSSIQQAFLLMHKISNYNNTVIKQYNTSVTSILENIRDFIVLHYITKKENSKFWKDIQSIELPNSLKEKLELWKYKLPISEDFSNGSQFQMFTEAHHILVMNGLGLFDSTAIRTEYEQLDLVIQAHADAVIVEQTELLNSTKSLPHKHMISAIRNLK
jgi:tryptophan halogenase